MKITEITDGFCSDCGSQMKIEWKRGTITGARCIESDAQLQSGAIAGRLGWALSRNHGGEGEMLALIEDHWCIACGKKLASKKESSGLFRILTGCSCGMTWSSLLGDLAVEMPHPDRRKKEQHAQAALQQRHSALKKRLAKAKGNYLPLAKDGDVEALNEIADWEDAEKDSLSYKWLCIAADFGHGAAAEAANDLLEGSSLSFDDDQLIVASVHRELAHMYTEGTEVPRDPDKAKQHNLFAKKLERK